MDVTTLESMPKAKAKARAKATAAGSGSNGRKAGKEGDEETPKNQPSKRQRAAVPVCFAKRKCPSTEWGKLKWETLRKVFEESIKPHLTTYSAHEES